MGSYGWKDGLEIALGFLTAIFTGVLASYAVAQFVESRRSSERQLRAYVNVVETLIEDIQVRKIGSFEQHILFIKILMKNFGQTPANDVISWADREYSSTNARPTITNPTKMPAPYSVPPGGAFTHYVMKRLRHGEYDALRAGTATLWVFGEIRYTDTFGSVRKTDFMFFVGGDVRLTIGKYFARAEGNRAT